MSLEKLPIAESEGKKPNRTLEQILLHESETVGVDCEFEDIQQLLLRDRQQCIPNDLANLARQMARWQLVVPTTFDVGQLLFLGRISDNKQNISFRDAQATIFIHRAAEGGDVKKPQWKYYVNWLELVGIFPDSNGNNRIVGVFYGAGHLMRATHVEVSIADDEYRRSLTVMESFIPAIVKIPTRYRVPNTIGLITQGMIGALPEPHKRVLSVFPNPTFHLHQIGGREDQEIDFDQGITLHIKDGKVEVGLEAPLGGRKPWTVSVPEVLKSVLT